MRGGLRCARAEAAGRRAQRPTDPESRPNATDEPSGIFGAGFGAMGAHGCEPVVGLVDGLGCELLRVLEIAGVGLPAADTIHRHRAVSVETHAGSGAGSAARCQVQNAKCLLPPSLPRCHRRNGASPQSPPARQARRPNTALNVSPNAKCLMPNAFFFPLDALMP